MIAFKTAAVAGLLLLGAAVHAQPAPAANPDFAAVQPGAYAIEPTHTRILFSLSHLGFTTWYGDFTGAKGSARIDPAKPGASSLEVSVPAASVATTNATLDSELKGAEWLDANRYPVISFIAKRFSVTGPGSGEIQGDLTLHGVTRPVTLKAHFNGAGKNPLSGAYTAGFEGMASIKRSDFGVTKYVPLVGDDVTLIISAAFERKA
ncbi:MAG: YceI family protein [Caulobacteraceae bacterium]|nr:YceI family protein [Caulobacteraceae bacterium]